MAKETRKQIVEQTRNEVARKYKQKIAALEERLKRANECSYQFMEAYGDEQRRADELQEKVNQYEDWIRRLQEFMDMEPDAREKAFTEMKVKRELNKKLNGLIGLYDTLFRI